MREITESPSRENKSSTLVAGAGVGGGETT